MLNLTRTLSINIKAIPAPQRRIPTKNHQIHTSDKRPMATAPMDRKTLNDPEIFKRFTYWRAHRWRCLKESRKLLNQSPEAETRRPVGREVRDGDGRLFEAFVGGPPFIRIPTRFGTHTLYHIGISRSRVKEVDCYADRPQII